MDTYLVVSLPNIWSPIYNPTPQTDDKWVPYEFNWIKELGTNLISEIVLTCGNTTIQKYSGDYLAAMVQRDFSSEKKELFNRMTGNVPELYDPANAYGRQNTYPSAYYNSNPTGAEPSIRGRNIYIPINMFFTLDSRCAFPMIALQYNELYITITLRPIQQIFQVRDVFDSVNNYPLSQPDFNQPQFNMYYFLQTPPSKYIQDSSGGNSYLNQTNTWNTDIHLISTYCFLSEEESRRVAQEDQIYLVKDVFEYNFQNITGSQRVQLTSSAMISSWMWYLQRNDVNTRNEWSNYTNWPYSNLPNDVILAPQPTSSTDIAPSIQPSDKSNTGYFISGPYSQYNQKNILQTLGIVLNGDYRENILDNGIYNYIEKYVRSAGGAKDGLYCYNFCLNTSPFEYQPSGAINMSKFRMIELEVTTYTPPVDVGTSNFTVIYDSNGLPIATTSPNWKMYEYNYNMKVFEERYNILSFIAGNCGMLYAR